MIIFEPDDPLVLNGTYDTFGFKPGERARIAKATTRQEALMAKTGPRKKKTPTHRVNTHSGRNPPSSRQVAPPGKKKHPRARPLPGMEDARISELDECAASISEIRAQMNELRTDEAGHLKNALKMMRTHKKQSWRHSGVELVRVAGEEKLRVRTSKAAATAEVEAEGDEDERVEVRTDGEETEAPRPVPDAEADSEGDVGPDVVDEADA